MSVSQQRSFTRRAKSSPRPRWLRAEAIWPKLTLAPTGVAVLVFVYGFIGWTLWLSFTKSTLLPVNR